MSALIEALCAGPSGLADVTQITFEVLPGGSLRWTAWDRGRRLVTAPFRLAELDDYLERTGIILDAMAAEPPEDHDEN